MDYDEEIDQDKPARTVEDIEKEMDAIKIEME